MKKVCLFMVVVLICPVVSHAATISLVGPRPGDPGTLTNPLKPSDTLVISVVSDTVLVSFDTVVTIDGPASFVGATDTTTGAQLYDWIKVYSMETVVTSKTVTFATSNFNIGLGGFMRKIAEVTIHCDNQSSSPFSVAIYNRDGLIGGSFDFYTFEFANVGQPLSIYIPEPFSLGLLGLGGLFLARRRA